MSNDRLALWAFGALVVVVALVGALAEGGFWGSV
jgi:hypothetical protein